MIYFDTNVYCRPFDDQRQNRIREEGEAFKNIVAKIGRKKISLITSDVLEFEINNTVNIEKRRKAGNYLNLSSIYIDESEEILALAEKIKMKCSVKNMDSLHLSSACMGKAVYFVTCDDEILSKKSACELFLKSMGYNMLIYNPVEILKLIERRD